MRMLNEAQVQQTWVPLLEEKTGITDKAKLGWMSTYCHYHTLNEGFSYPQASLLNVPGMGNVTPAGAAAGGAGLYYGNTTTGSGDKFPSLLPLAIQVAARTIGFDIVSVIPMNGPSGVLTFLDYVYAGGKDSTRPWNPGINSYTDKPLVFKIRITEATQLAAVNAANPGDLFLFASGTAAAGDFVIRVAFVGKSRVDGHAIFRVIGEAAGVGALAAGTALTLNNPQTVTLASVFEGSTTMFNVATVAAVGANGALANTPELVKGLEDHVQGFAGSGPNDNVAWSGNFTDGTVAYEPMRRGVGEEQYYRTMGLQAFTKFVEAETFQVAASITTEQIQDLNRQYGIDVVSMMENALVNDISQSINKHILSRGFALGWQNHFDFSQVHGESLNLQLDPLAIAATGTPNFIGRTGAAVGTAWFGALPDNVPAYANFGGFENQSTAQRRIFSKVLAAGNLVAQRGRRGPANFIITNLQLATALQDNAQYSFAPMANTLNQNNGSLYPVGTVAGMTLYVDPNMTWDDTRVLIGRKGADEEPGLKFMPYLMAESIQTIAEGTMSPKVAVKSRYALVEAGHHPQTQYLTIYIATPAGGIA